MAPEIYNGNEYGFEADIYSLGVVLYKLLNNNRDPFLPPYPNPVKYSDKTEAMVKRIQGLPMPKPANADDKLAAVIFKACAHNPEDRYQHPRELRMELEAIIGIYAELQSEVFSDNGINYYTNNSVFGSEGKSVAASTGSVKSDTNPDEVIDDSDEEGTMLLVEPTDDDKTVIDPANFASATDEIKVEIPEEKKKDKPPVIEVVTNTDTNEKLCPSCKKVVKEGNVFCGHCGYNLLRNPERTVICPQCGFDMKPGVMFCGKCGYKL